MQIVNGRNTRWGVRWVVLDGLLVRVDPVRLSVVREAGQFAAAVVLVVHGAGHVLQVLKVRPYHHVAQREEVAVLQILHCNSKVPLSYKCLLYLFF